MFFKQHGRRLVNSYQVVNELTLQLSIKVQITIKTKIFSTSLRLEYSRALSKKKHTVPRKKESTDMHTLSENLILLIYLRECRDNVSMEL